jgi:hypothetical protein
MTPVVRQPGTTLRYSIALITGLLLFLLQIQFSKVPSGSGLDTSWQEVLNWGILHGAQWGKDLVFTYGPLGFLTPGALFDPSLYWVQILLQACMSAICAWLMAANIARMPLVTGMSFLLVTLVLGLEWGSSSAAWYLTYPLALLVLNRVSRQSIASCVLVVGLATFEAMLPLMKFSVFPLWLLWIPTGFMVLYLARLRKLAAVFLGASIISPVVIWLLSRQHISNLPAFFHSSWQVALYYGPAMQAPPDVPANDLVAITSLLFALIYIGAVAWSGRRSLRRLMVTMLLAAALVLAYRAGTLRADGGHLLIFWSMCAWTCTLVTGILVEYTSESRLKPMVLAVLLALTPLALLPLSQTYPPNVLIALYSGNATVARLKNNVTEAFNLRAGYSTRLRQWNQRRAALALPAIDRTVGHDSIDLLMHEQGVLLGNDLNYRPRPVFQSYTAYSDYLSRLNGNFYLSTSAPDWVMVTFGAYNDRYPNGDDPRAMIRILQTYHPVLSEDHFILFRRTNAPATPFDDMSASISVPLVFDTDAIVPMTKENALFAKFRVNLTVFGKLHALLTRESTLFIDGEFHDGSHRRYSITRAIAKSGFLISPALNSADSYLNWVEGDDARVLTRLRLVQSYFLGHPEFQIMGPATFHAFELPRKQSRSLGLMAIEYPGFNALPTSISEASKIFTVADKTVMFLPGQATLTFSPPAGTYTISARYGIMPNALTTPACLQAKADGIGIGVGIEGSPVADAMIDYLNPFKDPSSTYEATFSRTLEVKPQQRVILSLTDGAPGSNGACDWTWIRDVRFDPH